jgi:tyrosine-protein kinase Etk/Wzc
MISSIDAQPGERFYVTYMTRLQAISDILDAFSVNDQGKDVGMLELKMTGEDPVLITRILDSISNYLSKYS